MLTGIGFLEYNEACQTPNPTAMLNFTILIPSLNCSFKKIDATVG